MATYKGIKRQIAELEKKAEELRKAEAARVIAGIKTQIIKYELTVSDLFDVGTVDATITKAVTIPEKATFVARRTRSKSVIKTRKTASIPKYMDPKTLKTWTGHGHPPSWIVAAAAKGKKDDFLIAKVEKQLAEQNAKSAKKSSAPALKTAMKTVKAVATPVAENRVAKSPIKSIKKPLTAVAKKAPAAQKPAVIQEPASLETLQPAPEAVVAPA